MAHFAKINSDNIVEQVIVVDNEYAPDETTGQAFIASIGLEGTWLQTSYNTIAGKHIKGGTPFRGTFAGMNSFYNKELDIFTSISPDPTWVFNMETYKWEPPTPTV
jgi:hypothetical protein